MKGIAGLDAGQRAHVHQLRGAALRRRPPHRPPAGARGDPRGPARRGRHARRPAAQRDLPRHRAGSRTATARPARRPGRSTSTPGATRSRSRPTSPSSRSRSRGFAAPSPRSRPRATCAGRFRSEGTLEPARGGRRSRAAISATSRAQGIRHAAAAALGRRGPAARASPASTWRALTGRDAHRRRWPGELQRHRKHRHAAGARGRARARARPEPRARVDHRQPVRPGQRARQRDPGGHRVRRMAGRARLGRRARWAGRAPHDGRMRFDLAADSLIGFDSLLLAVTGQTRDTRAEARPLGGRGGGAGGPGRQPRLAPGRGHRSRSTASSGCDSARRG